MTTSQQNYTSKDALKNKAPVDKSKPVDANTQSAEKKMKGNAHGSDCGC